MLEQGMLSFALLGAGWVLWLLVALSVVCIGISAERAWYLLRDGTPTGPLAEVVNRFLTDGNAQALRGELTKLGGMEARVLGAGLEVAHLGPDAAEKAMIGTATAEKLRMERGLLVLATTGSNAPFLGLFGTVLGIIKAFHDLAENVGEASEAVMAGISEALVATAVGLLVAIPAVVLYNAFSRGVKSRMGRTDSLSDLLLARLQGEGAAAHGK